MKFKKYTSIENVERSKMVKMVRESIMLGFCGNDFIVEEKIHGANFSFYYDGHLVEIAKRTSMIESDNKFYGAHDLIPLYESKLRGIYTKLGKSIRVVGELYGGSYPHKDVEKLKVSAVQKGVFYRPDVDFIAFDLYTLVDGNYILLDKDIQYSLFDEFGIPYSKPLMRGTFEECLEYSNEFQTTIPNSLGLPEIENNICEGVVIKPNKPGFFANGSRIILKNKNSKFKEVDKPKRIKDVKEIVKMSPELINNLENKTAYLTENRLRNVLSKIGEITNRDFGKLLGLFVQDALEDYNKDHEEILEKESVKRVNKFLNNMASDIIRKNFLDIIDGEF